MGNRAQMGSTLGVGVTLARVVLATCVGDGATLARLTAGAVAGGRAAVEGEGFNLRVRTRFPDEGVAAADC